MYVYTYICTYVYVSNEYICIQYISVSVFFALKQNNNIKEKWIPPCVYFNHLHILTPLFTAHSLLPSTYHNKESGS